MAVDIVEVFEVLDIVEVCALVLWETLHVFKTVEVLFSGTCVLNDDVVPALAIALVTYEVALEAVKKGVAAMPAN